MTNFTIEIAGQVIAVSAQFESTRSFCGAYLCGGAPVFSVAATMDDIAFERAESLREDRLEGLPEQSYSDAYLETLAVQRKITEHLIDHDILLFHGSAIAVDGVCYLFTAKSGTGKSTHTRLWRQLLGDRAVMVNDDKPFLRIGAAGALAYGTPWNGKHRLGARMSAPLKAICMLERGETNSICRIPAGDALTMLLQQSQRPADPRRMLKYMELLDRLSGCVEFYRLACNMEPDAAKVSYEAMSGDRKDAKHEN